MIRNTTLVLHKLAPLVQQFSDSLFLRIPSAAAAALFVRSPYNWRSFGTSSDEGGSIRDLHMLSSTVKDKSTFDSGSCPDYIEKMCSAGSILDAVHFLHYMHDQHSSLLTCDAYNILLKSTAEAKYFGLFSKIFKLLLHSKWPPDLNSYKNVAKAFEKVDSETILKFVVEISEVIRSKDPSVMNQILYATATSGQTDTSLMIFSELKSIRYNLDVVTFNTVLAILGRIGQWTQMLSEFELMKELGHVPDIFTYNILINTFRKLGRLDLLRTFLLEMIERGIDLELRTYTSVIDAYGRSGHINEALVLFDEMKRSIKPSIYVYRAMISNLKKAGKSEAASRLSEEMNENISELLGPGDFKQKKGKDTASAKQAGKRRFLQ